MRKSDVQCPGVGLLIGGRDKLDQGASQASMVPDL
jgi:hypothetical protein